jgi:hypothetical protein
MSKPGKAIPKVGPQLPRSEPRGSEYLEEVSEGSVLTTNLDAPPDTFHAGMVREDSPEFFIGEKSVGPTDPLGVWDEDFGKTQVEEEERKEPEGEEPSSTTEDEVGKEASSEAKVKRSEMVPRERFDQVNDKLKEYEKDSQMLRWILDNPQKFSANLKSESEEAKPPTQAFKLEEPKLPVGKASLDEMSDKEVFDYAVRKEVSRVLSDHLGGVFKDLDGLKTFKGSMEDLVMKAATGPDSKPLFPRWEELRPQVGSLMQRHPTLDKREAYVLAERMTPVQKAYEPPPEVSASAPPKDLSKNVPDQGPLGDRGKRGSPAAIRAARLVNLGRASGAYSSNTKPKTPKVAIELAMADLGFPGE